MPLWQRHTAIIDNPSRSIHWLESRKRTVMCHLQAVHSLPPHALPPALYQHSFSNHACSCTPRENAETLVLNRHPYSTVETFSAQATPPPATPPPGLRPLQPDRAAVLQNVPASYRAEWRRVTTKHISVIAVALQHGADAPGWIQQAKATANLAHQPV
jgi:hypothetical protein